MKQLTQTAQKCLDKYLDEVRLCLKGIKSVDTEDIQRDVNEHIQQELVSAEEPVSSAELEAVLERLGDPQQWAPQDELFWFRKILLRLRSGPDDWRLGYITLAVFILACIPSPGALLLVPLSFYLALVTLKVSGGPDRLGNQKYLIFPPLACVYLLLTVGILGLPFLLFGPAQAFEKELCDKLAMYSYPDYWIFICSIVFIVAGTWWLAIGILSRSSAKKIYYPFPEGLVKVIPFTICVVGTILIVTGLILKFFFGP